MATKKTKSFFIISARLRKDNSLVYLGESAGYTKILVNSHKFQTLEDAIIVYRLIDLRDNLATSPCIHEVDQYGFLPGH